MRRLFVLTCIFLDISQIMNKLFSLLLFLLTCIRPVRLAKKPALVGWFCLRRRAAGLTPACVVCCWACSCLRGVLLGPTSQPRLVLSAAEQAFQGLVWILFRILERAYQEENLVCIEY